MKYIRHLLIIGFSMLTVLGCENKIPPGFLGSGTLEATEVRISALTMGTILQLAKAEGDQVAADELLAKIDVEKLELQKGLIQAGFREIDAGEIAANAAIAQAKENFENVGLKYNRIKALYKKGSATQQQMDDISTQLALARSQLTSAEAQKPLLEAQRQKLAASLALLDRQIADGRVHSPIKGVVLEKYSEPGEMVAPGGGLYKIADLDHFWIKIYLSEEDVGDIVIGSPVEVIVDALATPLAGTVAWVSAEAEFTPKNVQTKKTRAELVYAVKITVDQPVPELKIGMPAEVYAIAHAGGEGS